MEGTTRKVESLSTIISSVMLELLFTAGNVTLTRYIGIYRLYSSHIHCPMYSNTGLYRRTCNGREVYVLRKELFSIIQLLQIFSAHLYPNRTSMNSYSMVGRDSPLLTISLVSILGQSHYPGQCHHQELPL